MNRFLAVLGFGVLSLGLGACGSQMPDQPSAMNQGHVFKAAGDISPANAAGNTNGAAGQMPALYDGREITVNMKELPEDASASLIGQNASVNEIYASNDLDDEQDFLPVIDAIQGDGFNPLWRQNLIVFNQGFTPHQFHSDDEVEAAASGNNPEITIVKTDEMYRCSVVGQ
jgi:hypothetical protein